MKYAPSLHQYAWPYLRDLEDVGEKSIEEILEKQSVKSGPIRGRIYIDCFLSMPISAIPQIRTAIRTMNAAVKPTVSER